MSNLIFDFDGTIADTMTIFIDEYRRVAHPDQQITAEEIEKLRALPAKAALRALNIPIWERTKLLAIGRKLFSQRLGEAKTFAGMHEALSELHQKHRLFIVSSNSTFNVETFLDDQEIVQFFEGYYGHSSIFGKAKSLKSLMKKYKLARDETLYIGDEVRDIEAARKAGIRIASVTWGFNSESILLHFKPDYIANHPSHLIDIFAPSPQEEVAPANPS